MNRECCGANLISDSQPARCPPPVPEYEGVHECVRDDGQRGKQELKRAR